MNRGGSGQRAEADLAADEGALSGGESQNSSSARQWGFILFSGKAEIILVGAAANIPRKPGPYGRYVLLPQAGNTLKIFQGSLRLVPLKRAGETLKIFRGSLAMVPLQSKKYSCV